MKVAAREWARTQQQMKLGRALQQIPLSVTVLAEPDDLGAITCLPHFLALTPPSLHTRAGKEGKQMGVPMEAAAFTAHVQVGSGTGAGSGRGHWRKRGSGHGRGHGLRECTSTL